MCGLQLLQMKMKMKMERKGGVSDFHCESTRQTSGK